MTKQLRTATLIQGLAFGVLIAATVYSAMRLVTARSEYVSCSEDLQACKARLPQIVQLRQKPDRAAQQSRSEVSLAKAIEESATKSGLQTSQVVSIEPQSPRRVADSSYEEFATLVRVEGISLSQLAKLAQALRSTDTSSSNLEISALRLGVPFQSTKAQDAQGEVWNVELTLTYLVYSPKSRNS